MNEHQLCTALWGIASGAQVAASLVVSWLLDNVAFFQQFWAKLSAGAKMLLYAGITILFSIGTYAIGRYLIGCAFPEWLDIIYIAIMAALGWLSGGYFHEKQKAK